MISLLQLHVVPLGAASRKTSSCSFAGLYRPILLLVLGSALILVLRTILLCPLAVVPPSLEQSFVGLLRLLALDILKLFGLGSCVTDGIVALL